MSIAIGTMSVTCNNCGNTHAIPADDADFQNTSGSERQMGPENEHNWQHTVSCGCGNKIEIDYDVWEYPVGTFDHDEVSVKGGTFGNGYDYDFHGEQDPN